MGHCVRSVREWEMPCVVYCLWQQTFLSSCSDRMRVCIQILLSQKHFSYHLSSQNFTRTFITAGFLAPVAELQWGAVSGAAVEVLLLSGCC